MPPAVDKLNITGPVVAAAIAGIVGWVLTVSVRVANNEATIQSVREARQEERERVSDELTRLRNRVSELEQQGSRLDERTRP